MRNLYLVGIILVTFLCAPIGNTFAYSPGTVLEARYVADVNSEGTNLDGYRDVPFKFNEIDIADNELSLTGSINGLPFALEGQMFQDQNSSDIYIGNHNDVLGNFEVAFFAVDLNAGSLPMFNTNMDRFKHTTTAVHLYMVEQGTRDFYFIETPDNYDIADSLISSSLSPLDDDDMYRRMWYSKYFAPVDIVKSTPYYPENANLSSQYNEAVYNDYLYVRDVFGAYVYELTRVVVFTYHPSNVNSIGEFTTGIEILSATTTSLSIPSENYDYNSLEIGRYNPTKVQTYTDSGSYISRYTWGGVADRANSFKLDLGLNYSFKGGFVSVSYIFGKSYSQLNPSIYIVPRLAREAQYIFQETLLRNDGHSYLAVFFQQHDSTGSKQHHIKWSYYIASFGGSYYVDEEIILRSNYRVQ